MTRKMHLLLFTIIICSSYGPPNCNLYKYDDQCYEACHDAEKSIKFAQGSKESQDLFDQSIDKCPNFYYSYYEKAVPFAKRGLIKEWKILIDKAVAINPIEHLSTRGWYHYFFMHNYEAAIHDIEKLETIIDYDLGYTGDGIYHINIMKALCYKGLGDKIKAIQIIQDQLNDAEYEAGIYDYLHLSTLLIDDRDYVQALENLEKQIFVNDVSEAYYYKGLCYKALNNHTKYKEYLYKALNYYKNGTSVLNSYIEIEDEIYLIDIMNEINTFVKSEDHNVNG